MARVPNVVIVDDHPAEQAMLRYFLSQRGIPSTALSPRAGLESLAAMAPDVVLLDELVRGSGPGLCQQLKHLRPDIRVVLLSGESEEKLRADRPDLGGADAVLQKPLDLKTLERVVQPVLDKPARKRVLVVDDDHDALNLVRLVLGKSGCTVTCVSDPWQILQHPPGDGFDLVLLDLMMPDLDGLDVCYLLRQHYGDELRICMMTAAARDPETVREAALYGADGWIEKPLRPHDLLVLVGHAEAVAGTPATVLITPVGPEQMTIPPPVFAEPSESTPPPPVPLRSAPVNATARVGAGHRVLVVDDDKDILEYCRAVLEGAGATVDAIQDPSCLRDKLPPGGHYDLVLLDIFMPNVDGIDLLRRFCADVKNVASRFFIITGQEDPVLRTLANRGGADGYLTKPLQPRALLDLLATAAAA